MTEIQKIRERMGLSQTAFADVIGVNQSTVWRWEAKQTRTPTAVLRLAEILASSEAG